MKKLMVYLEDEMHEDLRTLAFKRRTTMAALIRQAIETTFEDELDRLVSERALEEAARNPESTMTLEEYLERRGLELPGAADAGRKSRARRAAG